MPELKLVAIFRHEPSKAAGVGLVGVCYTGAIAWFNNLPMLDLELNDGWRGVFRYGLNLGN